LVLLYFSAMGLLLGPLENYCSRLFERHADLMALASTGLKEAFMSGMEKLASQNLADRSPHPVIKFFFFDHPPIDERIEMAEGFRPSPEK
jgi:STE24 endopeptidase